MTTRTISLPDESIEFAEAQARREGHGSLDAYLAAILDKARLRAARLEFEAKIQEGIDSGPGEPVTPETWEALRREGIARLEAERRGR